MHELVCKPVDGYGGDRIVIGPHATEQDLAAVRRQIRTAPHRWVAQELVDLSTQPVFDGHQLAPRHVDLRAFVFSGAALGGRAGRPDPGRPGGQHDRQLVPRRRLEGHMAAGLKPS